MNGAPPPAAAWFARAYHQIHRGRHLLLHGNIDDLVRWDDDFRPLSAAIPSFLAISGFRAVTRYDQIDGLTFLDEDSHAFVEAHIHDSPAPGLQLLPASTGSASGTDRGRRLSDAERQLQAQAAAANRAEIRTPADLLAAARGLLTQRDQACAVIIDQADLIFGQQSAGEEHYQTNLACLRKMLNDAEIVHSGEGPAIRNIVVLLANTLRGLPEWIHRNNPHVAAIEVPYPSLSERTTYLRSAIPKFHDAEGISSDQADHAAQTLANLCEGMTLRDVAGLASTSRLTKIAPTSPRALVMRHRFGRNDDPWEQLDRNKVQQASTILAARVIGQDAAVQTVSDVLVNARVGLDFVPDADAAVTKPKGVFFFVGPTGVGKTELAKGIADLVFDDETAMRRFDMSEFSQEHASERLTGAPPGFVGHDSGGVLTNWMLERPFSVVLFDEIEKANPKIFDKFLQIIDDGRLTDGLGRTAHFSQSVVIFTSNIGASGLPDLMRRYSPEVPPPYPAIQEHFHTAVADYMTHQIGRPELLGRLGSGIVVFDILRPEVIANIVAKFLDQLAISARVRGFELIFDHQAIQYAVADELGRTGAALGARQIRSPLLEEWVRRPLNRFVIDNAPAPGARIWVHRNANSPPFAVEEFPAGGS